MSPTTQSLRLAIYNELEVSSHQTVPELAQLVDSGAPVTQAQVRSILHGEPEVFWPEEERWDLAIFHGFAEQPHRFQGRQGQVFDPDRFLKTVLAEAMRLKGEPINLVTLAEKYLLKVSKSLGISKQHFPADRRGILRRLNDFAQRNPDFHLLRQNGDLYLWRAAEWPQQAELTPSAYFLPGDFLDRTFEFLDKQRRHQPTRLLIILQEVLGIDANHADFSAAFSQANSALSADSEGFVQVQEQAWMLAGHLPPAIEEIPARIAIPRWRNPSEEKLVDALYAEWSVAALEEARDFVDEETPAEVEAAFDESYLGEMRFVLPYRWRQAGVLKVNARERRLLPDRPARVHLQFHDQNGASFPVWLNNDTGYLYGLQDWYAAYLVPAGGVFYLQRSPGSRYEFKLRIIEAQAHTFDGRRYVCEVDADTYIEEDRLRDLEALRAQVEAAQATIKDVVCDVFESSGPAADLHYKQVWAQVHVVRPTTRRTVASILSAFPCFYQVEPGSGLWRYAPTLRNAPSKPYQANRLAKTTPVARPVITPAPRPVQHWLVPVQAESWEELAYRTEVGTDIFMVPWQGRSRIVRGDQLVFLDTKSGLVLGAAELLREPVVNAVSDRGELTVKSAFHSFSPFPCEDLSDVLSMPMPDLDDTPMWIPLEDWQLLSDRLQPKAVLEPTESASESRDNDEPPVPVQPEPDSITSTTQGANVMPVSSMTSSTAFEFLLGEVEAHLAKLQSAIDEANKQGTFDKVGSLASTAQELKDLKHELSVFEKRYERLIEAKEVDRASVAAKRVYRSPKAPKKTQRIRRGLKTPENEYRIPILQALEDIGGSGKSHRVLDRVYELMKDQLNEHDLAPLSSNGTPRWRNSAEWARNSLRDEGLLRDDSPRSTWQISEEGRAWLMSQ